MFYLCFAIWGEMNSFRMDKERNVTKKVGKPMNNIVYIKEKKLFELKSKCNIALHSLI